MEKSDVDRGQRTYVEVSHEGTSGLQVPDDEQLELGDQAIDGGLFMFQEGLEPEWRDIVHGDGLQYRKRFELFFYHHYRNSGKPNPVPFILRGDLQFGLDRP